MTNKIIRCSLINYEQQEQLALSTIQTSVLSGVLNFPIPQEPKGAGGDDRMCGNNCMLNFLRVGIFQEYIPGSI